MVFEQLTIETVVTDRSISNCQTYRLKNVPNTVIFKSLICQLLKHFSSSDYVIMRKEIGAFVTNLVKHIAMNVQEEVEVPHTF
jgi:hypothetical protein